jgi:hypothetical protein
VLNPGSCTSFHVTIHGSAFETSCYRLSFVSDSTGACYECDGTRRGLMGWHARPATDHYSGMKRILGDTDMSTPISFRVENTGSVTATLSYRWIVVRTDGSPSSVVSLDGFPPGFPTGDEQITLDPGQDQEITVDVRFLVEPDSLRFYDLVLEVDPDFVGIWTPLASLGLRSITAGAMDRPCEGVVPDDDLRLTWLSPTSLAWTVESDGPRCSSVFNLYRYAGEPRLSDLDEDGIADDYGECYQDELTELGAADPFHPAPSGVHFYLVTGENDVGEGSLGANGAGAERPNVNPCP